eukprot:2799-Heterococcus_DN1.PRE.1
MNTRCSTHSSTLVKCHVNKAGTLTISTLSGKSMQRAAAVQQCSTTAQYAAIAATELGSHSQNVLLHLIIPHK